MGSIMDRAVSSADANRQLSRTLREVRAGSSYVVTAHGNPVLGSFLSSQKCVLISLRRSEPCWSG